jgi:hypothetical protein
MSRLPCPAGARVGPDESELALASGGLKSDTGAVDDQVALHLSQTRHDVEKEAPCGRLGVDAIIYRGSLEILD